MDVSGGWLTQSASTRERLLAAAQELIEEGGYGAASVAAIAERTGVAAGTLYRHFDSKQELFVEVFRSRVRPRGAGDARRVRAAGGRPMPPSDSRGCSAPSPSGRCATPG